MVLDFFKCAVSIISTLLQVSPVTKNRSPPSSNGGGVSPFARWSSSNNTSSKPCQTYENLDFLYRNPPANSAPSGASVPPPLPAKSVQRGMSLFIDTRSVLVSFTDL